MRTKIIAHRGDQKHYPENTMVSFQSAVKKGVDAIELDIHLSQDGKLVVHHDYYLGTTNNGKGLVTQRDSRYLKSLDAGSWFSKKFTDEKIPFLEEVFEVLKKKVRYEIELKGYSLSFLEATLELVRHYDLLEQIEFTSPHPYILSRVKALEPNAKTGCFMEEYPLWMTSELGQAITAGNAQLGYINVVHCPPATLSQEFTAKLQHMDLEVHAADCNTEDDIKKALSFKVDQMSTNEIDLVVNVKKSFVNHLD